MYLFFFSLYCGKKTRERELTGETGTVGKGTSMEKKYQVSEAAEELETEVYTLRYWETQLGIEVPRNGAGHRYYEEEQIVLFRNVKRLKEAGFGLRQIKAMGERMSAVAELSDEKLAELRERIASLEAEQETVFCKEAGSQKPVCGSEENEREPFALSVGKPDAVTEVTDKEREDGMRLLQEGMTKWLGELLQKNNEQLTHTIEDGVSERMARELRFLFRQQEEREEERYRRLDRTIREYQQARAAGRQPAGRDMFLFSRKIKPLG